MVSVQINLCLSATKILGCPALKTEAFFFPPSSCVLSLCLSPPAARLSFGWFSPATQEKNQVYKQTNPKLTKHPEEAVEKTPATAQLSAAFSKSVRILKSSDGAANPSSCSHCAHPAQEQLTLVTEHLPQSCSNLLSGQSQSARQKHIFKCMSPLGFSC